MSESRVWSVEDLKSLTQIENHKILFDGYEYYWMRKLKDDWERHFILNFKDKNKAISYLKYSIVKWDKYLYDKTTKERRASSYKEIIKTLDIQEKTHKIIKSSLPTIEKINHIRLINKGITVNKLSELLNLKKSIVYRHIRKLESRGTLLCA